MAVVKVTVCGNTFPVKEQIKEKGCKWNGREKNWERELIAEVEDFGKVLEEYKFKNCRTTLTDVRTGRLVGWTKDGDTKPPTVEEGEEQTDLQMAGVNQAVQGERVRIRIPAWLARQNDCVTVMEGVIDARSQRAVHFVGNGIVADMVTCARCGRELTNPVSRLIGIGPTCCEVIGIDRGEYERRAETEEGREYLRSLIRQVRVSAWFPVSRTRIERLED